MKVIRARSAGFCMGVSLALKRLDAALKKSREAGVAESGRLITFGPVIHNPRVIRHYEEQGVLCFDEVEKLQTGDTVLIRAHGIPQEVENAIIAKGVRIIDATCPRVKQAQLAIAAQRAQCGGSLLLYGEAEHPEVKGLVSYAQGDAHVFTDINELDSLNFDKDKQYFLAAQTTQDMVGFEPICEYMRKRLGHDLPILHTICDATRKRQREVLQLAAEVDAVVVVGGSNSGNTRRLAEVVKAQGIDAILVEDVAGLDESMFSGMHAIGLTAGASTPADHIAAVENWLSQL